MRQLFSKITDSAAVVIRSQRIGLVLSTYGVAGGLTSLGIHAGKFGLRAVGIRRGDIGCFGAAFGRNLAKTFVKLGPTFIKLGQILATRPDLVGESISDELKVLFDRVPPISFRQIQKILRAEIGEAKLRDSFRSIETKPLAAASIGQVHQAVLNDGSAVILKVQKPGVSGVVRADLKILEKFIYPLDFVYPRLQLLQMFEDFKQATLSEIDFRKEAENINRFQKNYRKFFSDSDVVFPNYYPELTTERVLVLQPMRGSRVSSLPKGTTVARHVAAKGLETVLEQIFDHGFFHADPHAGNLFFIEEEGRLGFIDLGLVGQLDPKDKRKFLKVIMAVLKRDREKLALALYELGTPGKKTNYDHFEKAVQKLLDEAQKQGIANVKVEKMLNKLLAIARRNEIYIPNRYVLMMRSCLLIEGVARGLDPNISVIKVAIPIVARSLMNTYNPIRFLRKFF